MTTIANGGSAGVNADNTKMVPGTRAIHRLVIAPIIPPIISNKHPSNPIEEQVTAIVVPESDIIPIGKKSINPHHTPTTKIESRIKNPCNVAFTIMSKSNVGFLWFNWSRV